MSDSITQDMRYRQSLMQCAAKYGVSRASRKYNKSWSYIYYWKARWDRSVESLACHYCRYYNFLGHLKQHQHSLGRLLLLQLMLLQFLLQLKG